MGNILNISNGDITVEIMKEAKEPLIKSWMNSLSPDFPIATLASACNSPAITSTYRLALENSESQSASPRLNQRFPNIPGVFLS